MDDGALLCLSVASRVAVACGLWARGVCGDTQPWDSAEGG